MKIGKFYQFIGRLKPSSVIPAAIVGHSSLSGIFQKDAGQASMTNEAVGMTDKKEGMRYLAYKDCTKCFGRGYTGRDTKRNTFLGCKCLKTSALPIDWVVI